MKAALITAPGVIEVNWQWLPTCIGMNAALQHKIIERVTPQLLGKDLPCDEETLERAHDLIVDVLVEEFGPAIEGLREYLDGLKFLRYVSDDKGAG